MFHQERCDLCGDCLVKCQWMEVDKNQAASWMTEMISGNRTPVVDQCITCYACNEICPTHANPFDLIAGLQEKFQRVPKTIIDMTESKFTFTGDLKDIPQADRIMNICVFGKTDGHLIQGALYDLPKIGGKPFFCWIMFSHMGAESIQHKHATEFVDRLASTGAKEIICFHDDCYAMLAGVAPEYGINVPFKVTHLSEYLVEYLKDHEHSLSALNFKAAYQRPCASRHTPEKEHFIDELFELCGVTRVERTFDRENAKCCAGVKLLLNAGDPKPDVEENVHDALAAGAEAIVCLCPMCLHSLEVEAGKNNLPLIFLGDLARMALGEIPRPALS